MKIIDDLFMNDRKTEVEMSLEERRKNVSVGAKSTKRIFQFGSIITICITVSNALAHFIGVETGTPAYWVVLGFGGLVGFMLGLKLEKEIENFLSFIVKFVCVEGWGAAFKSANWWFTVICFVGIYAISYILTIKSKTITTTARFQIELSDPLQSLAGVTALISGSSGKPTKSASEKKTDCESRIDQTYDAMITARDEEVAEIKKRIKKGTATEKDFTDKKFLTGLRGIQIEEARRQAKKDCNSNTKADFESENKKAEYISGTIDTLLSSVNTYNGKKQQQADKQIAMYDDLIQWLAVVFAGCVVFFTVVHISNEDNEKK